MSSCLCNVVLLGRVTTTRFPDISSLVQDAERLNCDRGKPLYASMLFVEVMFDMLEEL